MILIPDIHINAKQGDKILRCLEEIFDRHDDKEVLFLWDYVFMFSYDRSFLFLLFQLFVKLYQQGRTIKVLSGNHDWIQWHFVFAEGKHAFDLIDTAIGSSTGSGSLSFITQPIHRIKDNNLHIIIPYNDHLQEPLPSEYYNPSILLSSSHYDILSQIELLKNSTHAGEQLSWMINSIALTYYETNIRRFDTITIYHHYYTTGVTFPTIKAKFSYKDGSFHPWLLNLPQLYLISWHIHRPFSYQHYLCCWSFWHTSTLEYNECKFYFVSNNNSQRIAHMIHINPQIQVQQLEDIDNQIDQIVSWSICILQGEQIESIVPLRPSSHQIDLCLQTTDSSTTIDSNNTLITPYRTFHIKHTPLQSEVASFSRDIESDYSSTFTDWKQLLQEYISHTYPEQSDHLLWFLQEHHIT